MDLAGPSKDDGDREAALEELALERGDPSSEGLRLSVGSGDRISPSVRRPVFPSPAAGVLVASFGDEPATAGVGFAPCPLPTSEHGDDDGAGVAAGDDDAGDFASSLTGTAADRGGVFSSGQLKLATWSDMSALHFVNIWLRISLCCCCCPSSIDSEWRAAT